MAGRAHEAENRFAIARAFHCFQRGADRSSRVVGDAWVVRRVRVKLQRLVQARKVFRSVGAENRTVVSFAGFGPRDQKLGLRAELFQSADHARRFFGMARRGISGASFVGNDFQNDWSNAPIARWLLFVVSELNCPDFKTESAKEQF